MLPLVAAGIGAGTGLLGHLFGQPHYSAPPPQTQGMQDAQGWWNQLLGGAGLAERGLTGDVGAFNQFTRPGLSLLDPMFERMRGQAMNAARMQTASPFGYNARATMLGGAENLANVNQLQAQTTYQNQSDSLNRMMQMMGLGQGAAGSLFGAGQYERMFPLEWKMAQAQIPRGNSLLQDMMGGAMMGYGMFGGGGQQGAKPWAQVGNSWIDQGGNVSIGGGPVNAPNDWQFGPSTPPGLRGFGPPREMGNWFNPMGT